MQRQDYTGVVEIRSPHAKGLISAALGIAAAFGFALIVFLIFALLITYTGFPESAIGTVVLLTTVFSVMIAGIAVSRSAASRGWLRGAAAGLVYMLILYLAGAAWMTGPVFDRQVILMFLTGFLSGAFGGIIGINMRKK